MNILIILWLSLFYKHLVISQSTDADDISITTGTGLGTGLGTGTGLIQTFRDIVQQAFRLFIGFGQNLLSELLNLLKPLEATGQQVNTKIKQLTARAKNSSGLIRNRIENELTRLRQLNASICQQKRLILQRISSLNKTRPTSNNQASA